MCAYNIEMKEIFLLDLLLFTLDDALFMLSINIEFYLWNLVLQLYIWV